MKIETTLRIAWRNIWRNTRRTLLTLAAIAFAVGVLVFSIALQYSSYELAINASVSVLQGHVQLQSEGYHEKAQIRNAIVSYDSVRKRTKDVSGVRAVAARAIGFALVSSEERSYGVQVMGVEPGNELHVSSVPGLMVEGRYLNEKPSNEGVIGSVLAKNLKVQVGDELTILGQGFDGSLAASVVPLVGIFRSGAAELDRSVLQVPIAEFQDVFAMPGMSHMLVYRGEKLSDVERIHSGIVSLVQAPVQTSGATLDVLTWDELVPGLKEAIELDMASGWVFYIVLILIASFTILNTFLMSVLERTREFGVIMALGAKPLAVSLLILIECLLLCMIGVLLGIVLGVAIVSYFHVYGFVIPGSEALLEQWNMPSRVHPQVSFSALTIGPLVMLVSGVLACLYPAIRVLQITPQEAFRRG